MTTTTATPPGQPISPAEKIEAMEFLLGQALLAIECDNAALRSQLERIEAAIAKALPDQLQARTSGEQEDDEETEQAFTLDSLGQWIGSCLERMRAHQAATPRQMVAIGELTERVLALGEALTPAPPPAIGPAAHAALAKAQQRPHHPK